MGFRALSTTIIVGVYAIIFGLGKHCKTNWNAMNDIADTLFDSYRFAWFVTTMRERQPTSTNAAPAEFQIPPQISRYASFMFSFIGRGICM